MNIEDAIEVSKKWRNGSAHHVYIGMHSVNLKSWPDSTSSDVLGDKTQYEACVVLTDEVTGIRDHVIDLSKEGE